MMKILSKTSLLLFAVCLATSLSAQQEEQKPSLDDGTIDSQFEYVIDESNNYQQYEVIPKTWMSRLRSHVSDTLKAIRSELGNTYSELREREEKIEELENELESTNETLSDTRQAQDEMRFIGIPVDKSFYRIIMWSIIGVLVLLLLIFIYRFNRSNAVTVQSRKALAEIQEEFDQHRKRSLEREQKLRRELQDELNKQRKQK